MLFLSKSPNSRKESSSWPRQQRTQTQFNPFCSLNPTQKTTLPYGWWRNIVTLSQILMRTIHFEWNSTILFLVQYWNEISERTESSRRTRSFTASAVMLYFFEWVFSLKAAFQVLEITLEMELMHFIVWIL